MVGMMRPILLGSLLFLAGCINITTQVAPENPAVKPITQGSDCSYIVFGFGYGTNTIEGAMRNAEPPVVKIRSITYDTFALLIFGSYCVTVVGEGSLPSK